MLADFDIPRLSNEARRTGKSVRGQILYRNLDPSKKRGKRKLPEEK